MRFSTTIFGAAVLLFSVTTASPLPTQVLETRDTAELYIFANCVNNKTHAAYAAIFWYYPDFLPAYNLIMKTDFPEPQETAIVSAKKAVSFVGSTIHVTTPFTLTTYIPSNATTAAYGTLVSLNATASSFAGPMAAFKGSGAVFYTPAKNVNCVEEYYQQDHQTEV